MTDYPRHSIEDRPSGLHTIYSQKNSSSFKSSTKCTWQVFISFSHVVQRHVSIYFRIQQWSETFLFYDWSHSNDLCYIFINLLNLLPLKSMVIQYNNEFYQGVTNRSKSIIKNRKQNYEKSFALLRLAHKFAAVLRSTTRLRASRKFKLLIPWGVSEFDQRHVTRSPPIGKLIWVGRFNNRYYSILSNRLSK